MIENYSNGDVFLWKDFDFRIAHLCPAARKLSFTLSSTLILCASNNFSAKNATDVALSKQIRLKLILLDFTWIITLAMIKFIETKHFPMMWMK
jgi:hypothetical protein